MGPWAAILLFPARAEDAVQALRGRRSGLFVPVLLALGLAAFLVAEGCDPEDAGMTGAAVLLALVPTVLGGAWGAAAGSRLTEARIPASQLYGPCAVLASWSALLWGVGLWVCRMVGAGPAAPIYSALFVLIWALASGASLVGRETSPEAGRTFLASCCGGGGALLGFFVGAYLATQAFVFGTPAPADTPAFRQNEWLLVRRVRAAEEGDWVLGTGRKGALLGRLRGQPQPGKILDVPTEKGMLQRRLLELQGRVFYSWGSGPVPETRK